MGLVQKSKNKSNPLKTKLMLFNEEENTFNVEILISVKFFFLFGCQSHEILSIFHDRSVFIVSKWIILGDLIHDCNGQFFMA